MGEVVRLTAQDGHVFDAYRAAPAGTPSGGVVIVQEIFGVTPHIRRVVDRYASEGFTAIAPALFDRVERGLVLDYSEIERGRAAMRRLEWPNTLADVQAAIDALGDVPVGVVGFCWGGTVAHAAAIHLPISAAVSYYGTSIVSMLDERPRCPVMYHFGDKDRSIPPENIERIRAANPTGIYHVYAGAGHGFDSEGRAAFSPKDSALAFSRSIAFLREHLRGPSKPPYVPA
ncbi:MAG TPA: dienelactone hydrolase family protein [Gammaproteobacteria bacterium]